MINEALNLFNNVYGAMHVEICACLRLLARLNYIMGDHHEVCCSRHYTHILIFLSHMTTNGHSNSSDTVLTVVFSVHRLLVTNRRLS